MRRSSDYNFRRLAEFQALNAVAIALGANWVITDMILLRMNFDLSRFGVIKSSMFLLPALAYWAAAGLLRKLNCDRLVCLWCYFARAVLPLAMPAAALLTDDGRILFAVCLIVFSGGYTFALFANNSLLAIYKSALPAAEFNRRGAILAALPGPVSALTALGGAWLLDGLDGDGFFRLLLILQLATLTADLPAMSAVYRVCIPERPRREPVRFGAWLRPFRNARFRPLLGFGFLHALWTGLLSTYLVVFLLKIKNFPPFWIILLELGLSLAAAAGASRAGRLADRYGYAATMAAGSAVIALASFGWALMPASALFLTLFLFLVYNGNNGFLSLTLRNLEGNASSGLAESGGANHYVAAFTLEQSLGGFSGCLLAGGLFAVMPGEGEGRFRNYFAASALLTVAMTVFALHWNSNRGGKHVLQTNQCRP